MVTAVLAQRGDAILRRVPHGGRVVEVGVLIGALSRYLLSKRNDISLVMVDNWAHAAIQPGPYKETRDVHALRTEARARQDEARARQTVPIFGDRVDIVKADSADAPAMLESFSFDLVFLDADHSEVGVKRDIAAWAPMVKPGGWLGGHDYANTDPAYAFGVTPAVDRWASDRGLEIELDQNFTWFARL